MQQLPKKSVWAMLGLAIITGGIYLAVWFWTRRTAFNRLKHYEKINYMIALLFLISNIILVALLIPSICLEGTPAGKNIDDFSRILNLFVVLTMILQAFKIRRILSAHYGIKLSGIATFIFSFYYIQYKINRLPRPVEPQSGLQAPDAGEDMAGPARG